MRTRLVNLIAAGLLVSALFCGCSTVQKSVPPTIPSDDSAKIDVRNNAASLLADLLADEKNLSKILIVKSHSKALGRLVDAISQTAAAGEKQLDLLASEDRTLELHALDLPAGEKATRHAISKTKEHDLLFSAGDNFEFNLLLTQTDALNYGSHLAEVAAAHSPQPAQAREFHALYVSLNELLRQVIAQMRSLPAK